MFLGADVAIGFVRRSHPDTYEWLAGSPRGVAFLFAAVSLPVLAVVTTLLLRLEGTTRPTMWDHLRHSVFWYVAGLLYWWGLAEARATPTLVDTLIALLPLTAIVANGLVMGAQRRRHAAA